MIRISTYICLAFSLFLLVTGCSTNQPVYVQSDPQKINSSPKIISQYHIGVDDVIRINVWRNTELSVTVPVRPDGRISMPLIGDVSVAGKTPEAVAKTIKKRLSKFVRDPSVTLMITQLNSHEYLTRLRVTGAVSNPSSINFRQGITVLDAILAAGSVNDFAAPNGTKLYRKIDNKVHVISINLGDILYKGRLQSNIELRPGDIITVPERLF